jgi:lipoic acid synthetase
VSEVMRDLRDVGCSILTVGQYLSPSRSHIRIKKYVHPEVFLDIEREAKELGFLYVACSPFVRSSFNAAEAFELIGDRVHRG